MRKLRPKTHPTRPLSFIRYGTSPAWNKGIEPSVYFLTLGDVDGVCQNVSQGCRPTDSGEGGFGGRGLEVYKGERRGRRESLAVGTDCERDNAHTHNSSRVVNLRFLRSRIVDGRERRKF